MSNRSTFVLLTLMFFTEKTISSNDWNIRGSSRHAAINGDFVGTPQPSEVGVWCVLRDRRRTDCLDDILSPAQIISGYY